MTAATDARLSPESTPAPAGTPIRGPVKEVVEAVVFDLGNVLIAWDPHPAIARAVGAQQATCFLADDEFDFMAWNHHAMKSNSSSARKHVACCAPTALAMAGCGSHAIRTLPRSKTTASTTSLTGPRIGVPAGAGVLSGDSRASVAAVMGAFYRPRPGCRSTRRAQLNPSVGSTRMLTAILSLRALRRAFTCARAAASAGPLARAVRSNSWIRGSSLVPSVAWVDPPDPSGAPV